MICWLYPRFLTLPTLEWQQCWSNNIRSPCRLYKSALLPHPHYNQAGAAVAGFINEHKNSAGYWSGYRGGTWCTQLLVLILDKLLGLFSKYFTIDKQVNEWMKKSSVRREHMKVSQTVTRVPPPVARVALSGVMAWSPLNIHYSITSQSNFPPPGTSTKIYPSYVNC